MRTIKVKKNLHVLWLLFWPLQTLWYALLEPNAREMHRFFTVHSVLDDYIPFIPFFVIFYLLWYLYLAGGVVYFTFFEKESLPCFALFVCTEIILTLLFCTVFPNGHDMRPDLSASSDFFSSLVRLLYASDPHCVTVMPSMHVMNAAAVSIAVTASPRLSSKRLLVAGCWFFTILVTLSTVLIKQHSVLDVLAASALCAALYFIIYRRGFPFFDQNSRHKSGTQ